MQRASIPTTATVEASNKTKVFWFFFSKKNCFLHACLAVLSACAVREPACAPHETWIAPNTLQPLADPLAERHDLVLLGEEHDRIEDHRWELATIQRAYAADPSLVLGFEMFPRSDQPVLDRWTQGGLSEAAFLEQSRWKQVWGFDPNFYLPIFRFARDHDIPMLALNVSSRTIHEVATHGFANVSPADREQLTTPAPASAAYRAELTDIMGGHSGMRHDDLEHFIDAQLTWDRAMAEAIARQRARAPSRPVLAIMGAGHLENFYGVPHQLADLGVNGALVLLPAHDLCAPLPLGYADAVFSE